MASTAWRGAIELSGFPVNVTLYTRVKAQRTESFKTLAPTGEPVKQQYVDGKGKVIPTEQQLKGVLVAKDKYTAISAETIALIGEGGKSTIVAPDALCPLETIPLDLCIGSYVVRPDDKVTGSQQSVNIVWNGLRKTGLAYVSTITTRAGSTDSVLVIYATDDELLGITLPFETELYDVPSNGCFVADEAQAAMFERVVDAAYAEKVGSFDHGKYASEYAPRRAAAIAAALAGKPVPVSAPAPETAAPDLMAMLAASVAAAPKKTSRKKVAA